MEKRPSLICFNVASGVNTVFHFYTISQCIREAGASSLKMSCSHSAFINDVIQERFSRSRSVNSFIFSCLLPAVGMVLPSAWSGVF